MHECADFIQKRFKVLRAENKCCSYRRECGTRFILIYAYSTYIWDVCWFTKPDVQI